MTNGWRTVELGNVMRLEIDAVPVDSQPEFQMAGVYSFARGLFKRESLPNTQTTYKFFHRLHKDMFVISVPKGWEGALARVTDHFDGMFLSPVFPTFRANPKELDIRYLEWYCRQSRIWDELRRKSRGIGARREFISAEKFLSLEIPIPSLDEQRRIVERVETLYAHIAKAQSLRDGAIEEAEVIEKSARNKIFGHLAKTINPVRFEEIAEMRLGKMLSQASKVSATPLPYLRNANIQWDRLNLSNVNMMDFNEEEKPIFRLKAGDILVCEGGDIGKSAIWNDELPECYFQKALHRIRVNTKITFPRFVLHHIFWAAEQNHFFEIKTQTTIPHLTGVKLKAYKVYLPPLDEQRRIVAYLDSVQARLASLRQLQSETQEELDALLPSVLDRAFKGEL